ANVMQQGLGILRLGDHIDAGVPEQPDDPLAREHDVVGDDYAHGITARRMVASTSSVPPSAPMRSARWTRSELRGPPSSATTTTSRDPSRRTSAETNDAPCRVASSTASETAR